MTNIYKTEALSEQSTTSTSWVDAATLTLTPGSTSENWLILASGVIRSSSTAEREAEASLHVGASLVDLAGHQFNKATTPNGVSFELMHRITGTTAEQTIKVKMRSYAGGGTTYVSGIRIVAAKIPADADFQWDEDLAEYTVTGANYNCLSLTWTPSSAGKYIVLGKCVMSEDPNGSTAVMWYEDEGETPEDHPDAPAGTQHLNARGPMMPIFYAWRTNYAASSQSVYARLETSGLGVESSTYGYPKLCAFREDAFEAGYYDLEASQATTTSTSFQTRNTITVPAPAGPRDSLTIQTARLGHNSTNGTKRRAGEMRRAGVALARTNHKINRNGSRSNGYHSKATAIDARVESGAVTYDNGYLSPDSETVQIAESVIICLRWAPEAVAVQANAPFFGIVA